MARGCREGKNKKGLLEGEKSNAGKGRVHDG